MRKPLLFLILLGLMLSGCSALMPTQDIQSSDAAGSYPNINAVPQSETKILTPEERDKMTQELNAARAKNKKASPKPSEVQ